MLLHLLIDHAPEIICIFSILGKTYGNSFINMCFNPFLYFQILQSFS
jgi:hypothetical protein